MRANNTNTIGKCSKSGWKRPRKTRKPVDSSGNGKNGNKPTKMTDTAIKAKRVVVLIDVKVKNGS
ncbi:MAG: hypothetical protein O2887_14960 [Bacteroidetes bacterium]|nr:hypothetical protein [Bacteroidota bacterium]